MIRYKALYQKMSDDLKDGEKMEKWAKELEQKNPEEAKYFHNLSRERVNNGYNESRDMFMRICQGDPAGQQMCDLVMDYLDKWQHSLKTEMENNRHNGR